MNALGGLGGGCCQERERAVPTKVSYDQSQSAPCFEEVAHYSLEVYSSTHIPPAVAASDILCVADKQLTS